MYSENDDEEYKESSNSSNKSSQLKDLYESNKKIVWIVGGLLLLLLMLLLAKGCSGNGGSSPAGGGDPEIIISSNREVLSVSNSTQLDVTIKGIDDALIVWNSSDSSVATVDQLGNVNAIKLGKATITATYRHTNGKDYDLTCEVIVSSGEENISVTDVSFPEGELLITRGDKYTLLKQVTPNNGYVTSITYSSSNESVVTVTDSGEINALSTGVATITMIVNDNKFNDEIVINVTDDNVDPQMIINPTAINFDNKEITIVVGKTGELTYQYMPTDAYLYDAVWESSDISVATVDSTGIIYGVKEGTAIITIKTRNGLETSSTVKVIADVINVTSISLSSPSNLTLNVNDTATIIPNVMPYNASNKDVLYTSSNSSVVSVDQQGLIRALSSGTAQIEVKTIDQGMIAMVNITVGGNSSGGNDSGGNSSGGGSSSCASSNFVTITSNSSSLSSGGGGTLVTSSSGGSDTITKGTNLEIKVASINCSSVTSLEYCANKSGGSCTRKSFKESDTIKVTIPSGSGVYQVLIYGHTSDGGTIVKEYYTKYNISGSSGGSSGTSGGSSGTSGGSSGTIACYKDTTNNVNVWGNYAGMSRYQKQTYTTKIGCLYTVSTSWKMKERKFTLGYGYLNYGIVDISANSTIKKLYYCISKENISTCTINTSKSSYTERKYGGTSPYGNHALLQRGETYARDYSTTSIRFELGSWDSQYFCYIAKFTDGGVSSSRCIKTVTQ